MTKPLERDAIYLKRHFDAEIIVLSVRWYITSVVSQRYSKRINCLSEMCSMSSVTVCASS
jgi:transposase-like protein